MYTNKPISNCSQIITTLYRKLSIEIFCKWIAMLTTKAFKVEKHYEELKEIIILKRKVF